MSKTDFKHGTWNEINTAPKGGGAELATDPNWVNPPVVILLYGDNIEIGYWDWYYAKGGNGYIEGQKAWVRESDGRTLSDHYEEGPIAWMPIPNIKKT
jgi:hypothetical protein